MMQLTPRLIHRTYRIVTVGMLLGLMMMSALPAPAEAARKGGGKTEVFPAQTTAPAAVVIETAGSEQELRAQMRAKNKVTGLATPNAMFSQAPIGSFGYIAPRLLAMALVTQSPDLGLERAPSTANAYEIHKLADGSGMVVGFIGQDLVATVSPSLRPNNIRIELYSNLLEKAPHIVAVPLVKLIVDRMPDKVYPKKADGPVMLDMDLQSTANRKSVPGTQ